MNKSVYGETPVIRRRKLTLGAAAMAAALLIAGLSACSSAPSGGANGTTKASSPPPTAAPMPTSGLPAAVEGVGHYGESLYDMAKAGDWAKAAADLSSLRQSAQQLRGEVKGGKAQQERLNQAVAALDRAVMAKDPAAAMREANAVTLIGADLAAAFKPTVPVEVTKLDYYGRELEIWSAAKNEAKLRETADGARRVWQTLRSAVEAHGGAAEAKKFGGLVAQMEGAKTPADFGRLATPVLDEVDNLEKVFTKK
jgi:hypothetical protein